MATVAVQNPGSAGLTLSMSSATAGGAGSDKAPPGSRLMVVNGSGASINLTVSSPSTLDYDGLVMPDRVVAVAAGATKFVDIPTAYADPSDGLVWLSWSAVTTVTFAALGPQRS